MPKALAASLASAASLLVKLSVLDSLALTFSSLIT
jgi:hypothetical protein